MPLPIGQKLGPYQIKSVAGFGGMGEVYQALDTRLNRTVAIKVLPPSLITDSDAKARFEREAKTISSLNHPNICILHDIGCDEGIDYLVLEFIEGVGLDEKLKQGKLPTAEALMIGIQIAAALAAAHKLGLVHRDLKPGNILITKNGAKLLDFGLAKFQSEVVTGLSDRTETTPLTGAGNIVGTLQYMSPEQLEGHEVDTRSDIFSFGATLYEMLTGVRVFQGESKASLIGSIMKDQPRQLSELLPECSPVLTRLIDKCLAKDPAERWQSTQDLKDELEWVASEDQLLTTQTTDPGRSKRTMQIAVVLLIIVTTVAAIAWQKVDAEREVAELALLKATKGQEFLSDMFTSSLPYGYGDVTTVADIIDRASEKLNESYMDDPEIEAELRLSLGNAYGRMGHYQEGRREIISSLALHEKAYGPNDDKSLAVMHYLFMVNRVIGDSDALLAIAMKKESAIEERYGKSHAETFKVKSLVAYALEKNGDIDQATMKIEEVYQGFRDLIIIDTASTIESQTNYAWLLLKQGKKSESKKIAHEAYLLAKSEAGDIFRAAQSTLAAAYIVFGELDSARALYENRKVPETFGIDRTFQGNFDLDNKQFQLLIFFETWCPFSRQAMKTLGDLDRQYNQLGLDICGMTRINRGAVEEQVDEYLKELEIDFTIVKENGRSWNYFDCEGTPSIRLLHEGYLIWEKPYYTSDAISTQMLESLVAYQSGKGTI